MNRKFGYLIIGLLVAISMVVSACQPQVIEKEVVVTQEVPVEVPAEPTDMTVIELGSQVQILKPKHRARNKSKYSNLVFVRQRYLPE